MNEKEIRKSIIDTCHILQNKGLVARTWGNISARLNDSEFIITPSGLSYDLLKPNDLVKVSILDCSYDENDRKPSSEKKIHASAYKLRRDVNFIVHTHQFYASAICADEFSITLNDGTFVPCAKYALPSTDKLAKNVLNVYEKFTNANMFLLAKHGTVIFGKDHKQAIDRALLLEKECKTIFDARVGKIYDVSNPKAFLDDYAQMFPTIDGEDKVAIKMIKEKNNAANLYAINAKPISFIDKTIQHLVYKNKYSKLKDAK